MLQRIFKLLKHAAMSRTLPKKPLIVVLGATGTGKSLVILLFILKQNELTVIACHRSSY
jgi:predicted GTPase